MENRTFTGFFEKIFHAIHNKQLALAVDPDAYF